MDNSRNRPNEYLGVNKTGKNIRKSPLQQPHIVHNGNNSNSPARQQPQPQPQPQPQVYNISKSDFRSIVQQLTGSPSRTMNTNDPLPRPSISPPPKHPSMRLHRIRPPPLTPMNRPAPPLVVAHQPPMQPSLQGTHPPAPINYNNFARPPSQFGQPPPRGVQPFGPAGSGWMNPALSPISAYMQQLQSCISDGGPNPNQIQSQAQSQAHGQPQMQFPGQAQGQPGLLPNPTAQPLASPRMNGGPALLPSPTYQLPSPSWFHMLSPIQRSPYPLLSPGVQFPPPLSPNYGFSPIGQAGILGSGPQPPLSPGIAFPLSPSGLFPFPSPRWRDP